MEEIRKYRSDKFHTIVHKQKNPEDILADIFGDKYRNYREKWKESSNCKLVQNFPLHVSFELIYGCNLTCDMCINSIPAEERNYTIEKDKKISFEKYCELIDEGVKHGLCAVQLNGYNEPLLQKDIAKFIKYARQAGIVDVFLITNGTVLTREISKEIVEAELTQIKFSVDSVHKETYEKIRTGANFETTMKNINNFLEIKKETGKKLPVTRVSFVKTKDNIEEQDDFVKYWAERVDYIVIQNMSNPFWGKEKYEKMEKETRIEEKVLPKDCSMPFQRLIIRNNGEVLPCCSCYGREIPVGNIYENSLYEIWNAKKIEEVREKVNAPLEQTIASCKKCRKTV